MPVFDKQTLQLIVVFCYAMMVVAGCSYVIRLFYTDYQSKKRFMPAIKRYLTEEGDLKPKTFFDIAAGCSLERSAAIRKIKSFLSEAKNNDELLKMERLVNLVEDYAPIQTSKAGLLANLSALETVVKNDQNLNQHFTAVKNEISSLSDKFAEYELSKKFNKFVAWLSVFGFIFGSVGLWYSITSPTAEQIAASILKIQSTNIKP